jgi:RNA polymerase-interacting CarD/CdnL/TRCF family regulator
MEATTRLFWHPPVPGAKLSQYLSALDRLCGEIALVDGISEEQAAKEIEGLLKTGTLKRSA